MLSVKLIFAVALFGLVCYVLGRWSGRRGERVGEPMLQTSDAPRTLDAARAAAAANASTHAAAANTAIHVAAGNAATHAPGALDADSLEEIKGHLRESSLIAAIKVYRTRTNCSLREAKDAVESIQRNL
ncbi:MAG: hypothetical protein QOD32_748 [Pyrinomonadaceae bacterium]|jgi:ribosomal protein L7/L12|nr:hypothetical protein [Pyrinomonadaceae bacterium]